jgi:replication factor A1
MPEPLYCHGSLLTELSAIFNTPDRLESEFPVPVCQCVQIKVLGSTAEGAPERYRLVLSDIGNFVQSMLATRKSRRISQVIR